MYFIVGFGLAESDLARVFDHRGTGIFSAPGNVSFWMFKDMLHSIMFL